MNSYALKSLLVALRNAALIFIVLSLGLSITLYSWKCAIVPHAQRARVVCGPYENLHRGFHQSWIAHAGSDWKPVHGFDAWTSEIAYQCDRSEERP